MDMVEYRVAKVVRTHEGPSPKSLGSDENFKLFKQRLLTIALSKNSCLLTVSQVEIFNREWICGAQVYSVFEAKSHRYMCSLMPT